MVLNIDLNVLPSEGRQSEESAAPIDIQYEDMAILSSPGSFSSPIDADAVEDDVVLLPSSAWSPQPRNRPRKKRPVTVLIDDSMATNAGQSGISVDKPVTIFCSSQCMHNAIPLGMIAVDCDLNTDGIYTAKPSALPMESTLNCPVCLCPLNEPSSTICGHVFCNSCIATAIEKQKKCPTCRKKLNKRNFHRIYLPSH